MKVRCKMRCVLNEEEIVGQHKVIFEAVISGSPENDLFFKYTPYGRFDLGVVSEAAAKTFEVGKEYFVDIELAE